MAACQRATPPSTLPTALVVPTQTLAASFTSTRSSTATAAASVAQSTLPSPATAPVASITPAVTQAPAAGDQNAFAVDFSADGRILVFNSGIDNLVPGDQNGRTDVFLYHTEQGKIEQIRPTAEDPISGAMTRLASSLSASGRFLLYGARSNAPQPAAEHVDDILLRDLSTGKDERIDFVPLEQELGVSSIRPELAPDGRVMAIEAVMDTSNIYLFDPKTRHVTPVSLPIHGEQADGSSYEPVFSPEGRYLAFVSDSSDLTADDEPCSEQNPACGDVFVYEIPTRKLERIPAHIRFTMGAPNPHLTVSQDARYLAWTELEDVGEHFRPVVRLYDRQAGTLDTICAGEEFCSGHAPSLSNDGRWLAFGSIAGMNDQGQWDPSRPGQVFLLDRQTGQRKLISAAPDGHPGDNWSGMIQLQSEGFSSDVHISGDGRLVAFSSQAANLLPKGIEKRQCYDPYGIGAYPCYDLFVYERQMGQLNWISHP